MNRLFFILFLLFCTTSQAYGEDNSGILVEANIGITHTSSAVSNIHKYHPLYDLRLGYRFNSRWAVGAMFKRDKYKNKSQYPEVGDYPCWGGFVEYTTFNFPKIPLYLFVDLHAYHGKDRTYYEPLLPEECFPSEPLKPIYHTPYEFTEVGFTPGIGIHIPRTPIDVKLRYLFVGFNNINHHDYKEVGGCLGRGNWILDAGVRRLEIGISATLNFWKK